ncbi:2-aminoadipate transaminase-like isoform X2 [Apis laboriosa]|uniref:2-aminoadipate transaminase-like isoform X2 n=1 Tax=Apis laboriosa TaxID=183418 RepID=UPI001CC61486|nr:2-aminoadipate transaminase-like isoform X2 [Apis laboriosa]
METISDPYRRHLFDNDSMFNVYKEETTNLSVGAPGPDLLQYCVEMMKKATDHRLEEEKKEGKYYLFQYGITAGLWECREELAKFLTRRYGDPVKRENLILTCGASHGLQLLLNTIIAPNGIIFVEEVTYMIALDAFKQFPLMKIITVPMKNDMVDVNAFEKIVMKQKCDHNFLTNEQKIFWAMFYTIPTFHNPTGSTLLADSEYRDGNIISNGTFSKIFSPGLRFGWMECSPRIAKIFRQSGILCSGGAVNHYIFGIVTSLLQLNIQDNYLDKLIQIYKERLSILCNILDHCLPQGCSYKKPEGGYFVWIHLPLDIKGSNFIEWCQETFKVSAIPGIRFSYLEKSHNFLRLSISFHKKEILETATRTLCKALFNYINNV